MNRSGNIKSKNLYKIFFGDSGNLYKTHKRELKKKVKLVYLDPPYNSRRNRGARKYYNDRNILWHLFMEQIISDSHEMLHADGFLAVSINQMELFNLKKIMDTFFSEENFVGLFPIKIRHKDRQLMINATYHDVYEYILIYRKTKTMRFYCDYKNPDLEKFAYRIKIKDKNPVRKNISGKKVEIYEKDQYEIIKDKGNKENLRRYMIAGKLKTANWSGEWFESHLRKLGSDKLVKVNGLENDGLGYRWFETQNGNRVSGIYYQSTYGAGRPILPCNDLDFTEDVTNIYREGGAGCDFKDSKKPERLISWLMDITTKENDLVLDLFGGSGTTLAVAAKKNRSCYIVEKYSEPYKILIKRMKNLNSELNGSLFEASLKNIEYVKL
jgi:adenine specific DNA methylase Mod